MADREKLTTLTRKQVTDIQNSTKTHMDLWHRTLGLRQQNQYINNTEIPVKTPPNHNKCSLVRNQPNTSLRPTHPVRTRSHERLHPQTSNGTGIPSQPPRGTPNPHNTHQETATTLDIRWDKMRGVHWTDTWINDTTNTTLAYRELVQCFLIANKALLNKTWHCRRGGFFSPKTLFGTPHPPPPTHTVQKFKRTLSLTEPISRTPCPPAIRD